MAEAGRKVDGTEEACIEAEVTRALRITGDIGRGTLNSDDSI